MSTDITKSGIKFRILASLSPVNWNVISFWGKAEDCVFESGKNAEETLGNITGITSSVNSKDKSLTTSAYLVNYLAGELVTLNIPSAAWSAGTTRINGIDYHSYSIEVANVILAHPILYLNTDNIPTEAEKDAYGELEMVADTTTKRLTFYIETVPTIELKLGLKGVEM